MNQGAPISTSGSQKKEEANPEYQCREIERAVNQLLEASAAAGLAVRSAQLCLTVHSVSFSLPLTILGLIRFLPEFLLGNVMERL